MRVTAGLQYQIRQVRDLKIAAAVLAAPVAFYTGFLFAQAKGRDFWQSTASPVHMFLHALIAGSMVQAMIVSDFTTPLIAVAASVLGTNLLFLAMELMTPSATADGEAAARMILRGRFAKQFWFSVIALRLAPFVLLFMTESVPVHVAAVAALVGLLITEHLWVKAPQLVSLV